jgi:hypothetical protein
MHQVLAPEKHRGALVCIQKTFIMRIVHAVVIVSRIAGLVKVLG